MPRINDNTAYSKLIRRTLSQFIELIKKDYSTIIHPAPGNVRKKAPNSNVHLSFEIFLQISGTCLFEFPIQSMPLHPDHLIMVPPGTPHREKVLSAGTNDFCNLVFIFLKECSTVHIAETSSHDPHLPKPVFMEKFPGPASPFYYHAAQALREQLDAKATEAAQSMLTALLQKALFDLGAPTDKNLWKFDQDVPCGDPYRIELVKKFITDNIMASDLSVERLAAVAAYSPNYLSHLFKKTTNESIKQFINRKKLEAGMLLLETTPYNIAEIAARLGYQDPAYFTKLFKRKYGFKPAAKRREKPAIE